MIEVGIIRQVGQQLLKKSKDMIIMKIIYVLLADIVIYCMKINIKERRHLLV